MLTFSGLRQHLTGVTILPAVLNILSEAVLVAQMHMYFLANLEMKGNLDPLSLHHIRGSAELSSASSCRYLDSSASACSLFVKPCVEGWAFLFCSRSHSLFFFGGGAEDVVGTSSSAAALSDTVKSKGVAFTLTARTWMIPWWRKWMQTQMQCLDSWSVWSRWWRGNPTDDCYWIKETMLHTALYTL